MKRSVVVVVVVVGFVVGFVVGVVGFAVVVVVEEVVVAGARKKIERGSVSEGLKGRMIMNRKKHC